MVLKKDSSVWTWDWYIDDNQQNHRSLRRVQITDISSMKAVESGIGEVTLRAKT